MAFPACQTFLKCPQDGRLCPGSGGEAAKKFSRSCRPPRPGGCDGHAESGPPCITDFLRSIHMSSAWLHLQAAWGWRGATQGRVSSVGMMRLLALQGSETLRDSSWERSARLVAGGSPSGAPRKGVPGPLGGSDSAQDPGFLVSFQRLLLEGWRQSPMLMRQASQ